MAATDPFYNKYGGHASPDFSSMIKGQEALNQSIGSAFQGVRDLLQQTENIYKENNTLNMQEYLKSKLEEEGLKAEPIDKTAIQRQFGNMINMDKLVETFGAKKKEMELRATEKAAEVASGIADPLKSRETFMQAMRDFGAPEPLVAASTQNYADANALRFTDYEITKTRERDARTASLEQEIRNIGPQGEAAAIIMLTKDLPEEEQATEAMRLREHMRKRKEVTPEARETIDHYMNMEKVLGEQEVQQQEAMVAELEAQHAALQRTGIPEESYKLAEQIMSADLGSSVHGAIRDKVVNWVEGFAKNNDGARVKNIYDTLIDNGVEAKDAAAILALTFQEVYQGDRLLGNNLRKEHIDQMIVRAEALGKNALNRYALTNQISTARANVTKTQLRVLENQERLRKQLLDGTINYNLGVEGAQNVDTIYNQAKETGRAPSEKVEAKPLPSNLQQTFGQLEKEHGLSSGFLARLAYVESTNNPNARNPKSDAKGMFQIIDSTAKSHGVRNPFDPVESAQFSARYAAAHFKKLRSALGRTPTDGELYLAHQQGVAGALRLLQNPQALASSIVGTRAVLDNGGTVSMTAAQFANKWIDKFENVSVPDNKTGNASEEAPFDWTTDKAILERAERNRALAEQEWDRSKVTSKISRGNTKVQQEFGPKAFTGTSAPAAQSLLQQAANSTRNAPVKANTPAQPNKVVVASLASMSSTERETYLAKLTLKHGKQYVDRLRAELKKAGA